MCVIHGLGGLGKTQLAIEYAHRFRESYDAVFWLSAETEFGLATDCADIARKLEGSRTISLTKSGARIRPRLAQRNR